NEATFTSFSDGEDFRLAWRTILNYVWHGNPDFTWDPEKHQIIKGKSNSYEKDIGKRFAKFLWDTRQSPWNNPCVTGTTGDYWGPHVLFYYYTPQGEPMSVFNLNWLHGTGAPSAIASQDFNLMAEMYRHTDIEWDITEPGDGYLTSIPHYFHGIFKILGMTLLTGNHQAPSKIKPIANMKVYLDIDKTFAYEGDTITYTIDYRNYGSKQAEDVTVIDTLPKDFTFVSSTKGGQYNSGSHTVTWNIGAVPGVKTATGIPPTIGRVSLKIYIENATKKQYANRVSISCSNGFGWTSNEYPNTISPVMKRNLVDIAKRALTIEKTTSSYKVNPKKDVIFSIHFLNSSEAGFINGGRSGIHFSYNHGGTPAFEARHKMRVRMFNDAQESYVNYGNYRVSYYMFDPGRTDLAGVNGNQNGWVVNTQVLEGLQKDHIQILHQNITPGSDENGKWNQRIILQFSDPADQSIPDTNWASMGAPTRHLEKHHGSSNRIHRGQTAPLRVEWDIATVGGVMAQWDDDWSWDPNAGSAESQSLGFPITPDYTAPDPDKPGIPVNKLNPKHCHKIDYNIDNILIEEWDGYTWRRVFGTSPMPGRDIENVKIVDTIPPEFTFKEFVGQPPLGIKPSISGNIITWEIPLLQINQGGTISYRVTASDITPEKEKKVLNYSWIEGTNESPAFDTAAVIITSDSLPPPPLPSTTMYKNSNKKIYYNNDTIKYTINYKQTHGSIVNKPTKAEDWILVRGDKKLPVDQDGTVNYADDFTEMVHQYAHGKNGILQGIFQQQPHHEFSLILRQSNSDYVEVWFKQEYADLSIQLFNSTKKIGPVHKITYPDFPKPFPFKIELKEDTAFIWIGDILSPLPGIVQTGIDVRHGYAGVKVMRDIGVKLLGWHSHFDTGFDLVIHDKLPFDIKLTKSSGSIVTGPMAGYELKHEMDGKTIIWQVVNGTKPFLFNDSLSITVEGIVDTCNKPFIVNTACANLYGHPLDSIGARNISIYGSGNFPVKLFADPPGGFYEDKVEVTLLSSAKDIKILYTINGTVPDPSDIGTATKVFKDPILLKKSALITAIGLRKDKTASDTLREQYEIKPVVIPIKLRAFPPGGVFDDSVSVQLTSSQKGITIIYTTDGTMPDPLDIGKNTIEYKDPINIKESTTITAVGLKNGSI
ncbi:MAG: FN3 associated domain-containing protein, partial [Chitinispirillia bacterium]